MGLFPYRLVGDVRVVRVFNPYCSSKKPEEPRINFMEMFVFHGKSSQPICENRDNVGHEYAHFGLTG